VANDALIISTVEVDVEKGKAQLREFEKQAASTTKAVDASFKKLEASPGRLEKTFKDSFGRSFGSLRDRLVENQRLIEKWDKSTQLLSESQVKSVARIATEYGSLAARVGLVATAIGAVVAAAVIAASKFADAADPVTNLRRGFETLTERIGQSSDVMLGKLKTATGGMISNMELMKATNQAIILQLPITSDRMAELADISTRLGRSMGIGPVQALDSMIVGIGRQSKLWLDNIGIMVDVDKAYAAFGKTVGKTADSLTDAEKRVAFFNAAIEGGRVAVKRLGGETLTFSEYWKTFTVGLGDAKDKSLDLANVGLGRLISALVQTSSSLRGVAAAYTILKGAGDQIDPLVAKAEAMRTAAKDPGGLALFDNLVKYLAPLDRLGITLGADLGRVNDMRAAIGLLRDKLAGQPEGSTFFQLLTVQIKALEAALKSALGTEEFKGFTGSVASKLPFPSNPSAPFGGGEPFGGRAPGLQLDPGIQGDPFGDAALGARLEMERGFQEELMSIRIAGESKWSLEQENLAQLQSESIYATRLESAERLGADTTALTRSFEIEQTTIAQQYADARAQIAEREAELKKNAQDALLSNISSTTSAFFGKYKAGAVASAIVSTYQGVARALAEYPWPYSVGIAALVAAQGLATVRKIQGTNVGSGGGGGGGSAGGGGGAPPAIDYSSAIRTPTGQIAGNATGTTPVISGASTVATAQAGSAPAINVTIHATDAKSITEMMADPSRRRAFADGVNQQNARR
jgi:hypothetical protein